MNRTLIKKLLAVFLAAVLIALVSAVCITFTTTSSDPASGVIHAVTRPIRGALSALADKFEPIYAYLYKFDQLSDENAELRARVAELEQEYEKYVEIGDENDRLKNLLKFSDDRPELSYLSADFLSWGSSSWSSTFTINRGSVSGVEVGDCVITEYGYLIGKVKSVSASSAVVETVVSPSSSISAMILETSQACVASGSFEYENDKTLLIEYLSDTSSIFKGQTVVTSGEGGLTPAGLIIGRVAEVVTEHTTSSVDFATVKPSADLVTPSHLYVITSF